MKSCPRVLKGTHACKRLWSWGFNRFLSLPYLWLYIFFHPPGRVFRPLRRVPHPRSILWGCDGCPPTTTERRQSYPVWLLRWTHSQNSSVSSHNPEKVNKHFLGLILGMLSKKGVWACWRPPFAYTKSPVMGIKPAFTSITEKWKLTTLKPRASYAPSLFPVVTDN